MAPQHRQVNGLRRAEGRIAEVGLGGGSYQELAAWRDLLLAEIEKSNPGLTGLDWDYKETKPQFRVEIDYQRAADLGVKVGAAYSRSSTNRRIAAI